MPLAEYKGAGLWIKLQGVSIVGGGPKSMILRISKLIHVRERAILAISDDDM